LVSKIDSFRDNYAFLSNFFPCEVQYAGEMYPSLEHAFQAAKTLNPAERLMIRQARTASDAKRGGRRVTLRGNWDEEKVQVMRGLVRDKFTRHPNLRARLLLTGSADLVEGNWWGDRFWGVCKGAGENWLGKILMEIRTELTPLGLDQGKA
jgi:ribA/ribD-fused uncharacterized protein